MTPFVRIHRGDGRMLDVWGSGLPAALERSGAQIGDAVQVRRDEVVMVNRTVDLAHRRTGEDARPERPVDSDRWVFEADRFRRSSPAQAARDARLRGAQSHLAVLNAVIDRSVTSPDGRARLRAHAREIVAEELARGRRFPLARIRAVEPVIALEASQAKAREAPERAPSR